MSRVENCENCGRAIGKLEEPYVWRKHVVCAECHVHLSSAPSAAAAAARPARAAPVLPQREHFKVRPPAPRRGADAVPIALQPEAPKAPAPSIFLCTACGQSYAFDDIVSDHGKLICRNCALAAAAQRARQAAREKKQSNLLKGLAAAAALLVIGGIAFGIYAFTRHMADQKVAQASAAARFPSAFALPKEERDDEAAPTDANAGSAPTPAEAAPVAQGTPRTLFPEATFSEPETGTAADRPGPAPAPAPEVPREPTRAPVATEAATPRRAPAPADGSATAAQSQMPGAQRAPSGSQFPTLSPQVANAGAPAQGAAPKPAPAVAPPPPEGTPAWHVYKGRELLLENKSQPAMEQFVAAIKLDRNNADAWHGSGLCYSNMGDRHLALERLEKAVTLYNPPNRAAVFNAAALNLRENPMRAAKLAKDYLARDEAAPDEAMHNLMGKALLMVNRQGQKHPVFKETEQFYFDYNARLEEGRTDGRKRWGEAWVLSGEATGKWNRYRSRKENVERLRVEVDHATKRKENAWSKLYDQRTGMRLYTEVEKREVRENYAKAARAEIETRNQLKAAEAEFRSTEKPPLPQLIRSVPMDPPSPGVAAVR